MYTNFLAIHNVFRWLVLLSLLLVVVTSIHGYLSKRRYTTRDKLLRIIANAITHTQLMLGFTLYFLLSPVTKYFMKNGGGNNYQMWFFGVYHILMMLTAVVLITIGGSWAKRREEDARKFKVTALYFSIGLLIILLSIPWFRPLLRHF
ncbi:MAG TPA: hypothetical protein DCS93_28650 [Microscillaceae bacterium]|nr:hypothetical protein [Microscillaceae bacterium]